MTAPDPVTLLQALVACPSVTPHEGGALDVLAEHLAGLGFTVHRHTFSEEGTPDVENLLATIGEDGPHLAFCGHTDVVPPGSPESWRHPPFSGEISDGMLYGRGAVDMKGGIACFVAALGRYLAGNRGPGRISLLITGDEEGPAINGTGKLLAKALADGNRFDAALVGEPTSVAELGDTVKVGRRGSLSGRLTATGRQGHVAYPHRADNPVPRLVAALAALTSLKLDDGTADFQPSNLEVASLATGTDAVNVIPGVAHADFNIRFNDTWTPETLKARLSEAIADAVPDAETNGVRLTWRAPLAEVFVTSDIPLFEAAAGAVRDVTGRVPERSTGGGTSDARFFKDVCPVIELGLVGTTMHQVDERVPVAELSALTDIYVRFLDRYFGTGG